MPYARVRPGFTYGPFSEHVAGDVLQVSDDELRSFGDKLEQINEPAYPNQMEMANGVRRLPKVVAVTQATRRSVPDITRLRMGDVLVLVKQNVLTAEEALYVETNGARPRPKLIEQLMILAS